jgi:hypothetical protein
MTNTSLRCPLLEVRFASLSFIITSNSTIASIHQSSLDLGTGVICGSAARLSTWDRGSTSYSTVFFATTTAASCHFLGGLYFSFHILQSSQPHHISQTTRNISSGNGQQSNPQSEAVRIRGCRTVEECRRPILLPTLQSRASHSRSSPGRYGRYCMQQKQLRVRARLTPTRACAAVDRLIISRGSADVRHEIRLSRLHNTLHTTLRRRGFLGKG